MPENTSPQILPEADARDIARQLRELNTSLVADVLRGHAPERLVMRGVSALTAPGQMVVGRARTLRYLPARPDIKAARDYRRLLIDSVGADEVLVFDGAAAADFPVFGDMTALRAFRNGAAGCVTDGLVRDVAAIEDIGLPVFAKGTWLAPSASFPIAWEMDTPIQCGGVLVMPGDWILGDADGVMVVPPGLVSKVLEQAPLSLRKEEFSRQLLLRGHALVQCYPILPGLLPHFERWMAGGPLPTDAEIEALGSA